MTTTIERQVDSMVLDVAKLIVWIVRHGDEQFGQECDTVREQTILAPKTWNRAVREAREALGEPRK